ncbi:MAG: DUF362 domain-containing protein, partial [candidate division Zixibacteria bacterium]|nr:DUF362 domain-containing protein [candidate division Zixibacteria bacterium]
FAGAYFALDLKPDFPVEEQAKAVNADYRIDDPALNRKLAVAEGDDPRELGRKVIDSLGGMEKFIEKDDRVVIKPNVAWDRTPEQAATTNPELVAELVTMAYAAGASKVVVTDVTCHDPRRTFARSGIQEAAQKAGAEVIIPGEQDYVEVDMKGGLLTVWPVLKYFIETDKVINVPIVKAHTLSRATLGMKNLYGIIGGTRGQLHQKIHRSIVDLATFLKPTLVVVDAYRVLMRNGPVGGSLDDVKTAKTIFATTDQVAADAFACQFLNLEPADIGHIALAEREGLGAMDYNSMEIIRS